MLTVLRRACEYLYDLAWRIWSPRHVLTAADHRQLLVAAAICAGLALFLRAEWWAESQEPLPLDYPVGAELMPAARLREAAVTDAVERSPDDGGASACRCVCELPGGDQ